MTDNIQKSRGRLAALLAILGITFVASAPKIAAQETLFPNGYSITVDYDISSTGITVDDTLLILRTVRNNESFALNDLYVAENLPFEFEIIYSAVQVDSLPVVYYYSGPLPNQIRPHYNSYHWLIDHPPPEDSVHRVLQPNEILNVGYAVVCSQPGNYTLPFHTVCCSSDTCGIFTTADSLTIAISPGSGIDGRPDSQLPLKLDSYGYPNPFNGEVAIKVGGLPESSSWTELSIFDITGKRILKRRYHLPQGVSILHWRPGAAIASGIYLYQVSIGRQSTRGRIILLK